MSSWEDTSAPWLFTACDEQGVEGIVLKRRFFELPAGGTIAGLAQGQDPTWVERHAAHRRPK